MHALERILRFRRLTEQQARRDLERATQLLRAATAACERQAKMVVEQRASLAHSWSTECSASQDKASKAVSDNGSEAGTRSWLLEEAALEFSGWTRTQLEQVCAAEARRIEPLVERYVECRRSLRQTERLVEQQAAIARVEQERSMQTEAEEWFLQQSLRRSSSESIP
jgi:hypothetical protein